MISINPPGKFALVKNAIDHIQREFPRRTRCIDFPALFESKASENLRRICDYGFDPETTYSSLTTINVPTSSLSIVLGMALAGAATIGKV